MKKISELEDKYGEIVCNAAKRKKCMKILKRG